MPIIARNPVATAFRDNRPPRIWLITPDFLSCSQDPLPRLQALLRSGLRMVQYRCRGEHSVAWRRLLTATRTLCQHYRALLLVNTDAARWRQCEADGIHLNSERLMRCSRRPVSRRYWFSASCHGPRQLARAAALGADFVTLSPVLPSSSHPGDRALGWGRFRHWAGTSPLMIYALGGLRPDQLCQARRHRAHGVAMISGLWSSPMGPRSAGNPGAEWTPGGADPQGCHHCG